MGGGRPARAHNISHALNPPLMVPQPAPANIPAHELMNATRQRDHEEAAGGPFVRLYHRATFLLSVLSLLAGIALTVLTMLLDRG